MRNLLRRIPAGFNNASSSQAVHNSSLLGIFSTRTFPIKVQPAIETKIWKEMYRISPAFFFHQNYATGFTSIHSENTSSEYAKLRKESLESKFGRILGTQSSKTLFIYYGFGPFLAFYRAAIISFYLVKLSIWHFLVQDTHMRARKDQIPPFPTHVAIKSIESQLGLPISEIFADISPEPIAAASLGQVYKAHLNTGELVAVKVQRPGTSLTLTLDALLFNMIGGQLKRFAKARKDLLVAVNEMVRHMFEEIDYILEGQNAERFATLYAYHPGVNEKNHRKKPAIKVPKIYWNFTRREVLTMGWIDGIKLTDSETISKARLDKKQLIDQGLDCSLRQLLEQGFFHGDPHPGNLVATDDGSLAYFDFGMMGDIPRHYRVGLIQVLVHYINRDSYGLANDFLSLGFIPEGADLSSVADALRAAFGDGTRHSKDFQGVMNQLYDVMYEFNFSLPPDYALVIRALGSLEGTAKALDPDFKVVESAYPFVIGRLLVDSNRDMRKILRQLLIRNDGSVRWNRFERLIAAISEQASESLNDRTSTSSEPSWKSFDMCAVVSATEDLLHFILSEKGRRVRLFLIKDILKASDDFLHEQAYSCIFNETTDRNDTEGESVVIRVVSGLQSLCQAVKLAPEAWRAMLIRLILKPEVHVFGFDIVTALARHSYHKIPNTFWLCISRFLHNLHDS